MKTWIIGARLRTLPAAIAPVVVASALAAKDFSPLPALLALCVSLSLQIGVNFANDYSDGIRGTDSVRVGPTRITAAGLATPKAVKRAAFITFSLAAFAGLVLAAMTTWFLVLIGVLAIIAAWGYTGGKNPYGYLGLGEIFVFIFFGVVATVGSYYVQVEKLNVEVFIASASMGAFACALLAINNLRDLRQDAKVGKRTLAVRLGDTNARNFFIGLILFGYITGIAVAFPFGLITLLTFPISIPLLKAVNAGAEGSELIPLLARTGKLQLLFALTFTAAILLGQI